jgi:hypothetical protein
MRGPLLSPVKLVLAGLLVTCGASACAQQQQQEKKPVVQTPAARLAEARNAQIVRTRNGSNIPFDVIKSTIDGWMRFTLVDTPDKADIIVEIVSSGDSSVQVSSSSSVSVESGHPEQSNSSRKDISPEEITMTVFDAKNKRVLWRSTEKVKSALKQKTKENNIVEAAERLASKFHERLEPPAPPADR